MLFGLSSHIGAGLICSFAPKTPHYYAHFRSKNFAGKKNSHIQGKSAVYPVGLTSILTQDVGIFLRQNRVRMCALWLSSRCTNTLRFRSFLFPCGSTFITRRLTYFKRRNNKNRERTSTAAEVGKADSIVSLRKKSHGRRISVDKTMALCRQAVEKDFKA